MKICEAGRSAGCCRNPDIRTINTMGADTAGNFEIRAGAGVGITTETNGIRIAYTGGITVYDNTDGNLVIDNDLFTINLADDLTIIGNVAIGGDLGVTGDATISGDLTVNGTYYTVHAEHVYTEDDYIIMRDDAVTGLGSGQYSGFQVKLYDGVNDGRLVIDNSGTARVGDVGDEQPLMTRDESADLTNGDSLVWDSANSKAVTQAIPSAIGTALAGKEDTLTVTGGTSPVATGLSGTINWQKYGKVVFLAAGGISGLTANTNDQLIASGLPASTFGNQNFLFSDPSGNVTALFYVKNNGELRANVNTPAAFYGNATYIA